MFMALWSKFKLFSVLICCTKQAVVSLSSKDVLHLIVHSRAGGTCWDLDKSSSGWSRRWVKLTSFRPEYLLYLSRESFPLCHVPLSQTLSSYCYIHRNKQKISWLVGFFPSSVPIPVLFTGWFLGQMVHDYKEYGPSIIQFLESSLPKFGEHVPTGVSNGSHNITGVNMLAWRPAFNRDDTRKRTLEIGPSVQLSI